MTKYRQIVFIFRLSKKSLKTSHQRIESILRREANHSHLRNAKAQSMKLAPQHQYSTKMRGSKPASQLHCSNQDATRSPRPYINTVPRREGRSPRLDITTVSSRRAWSPRFGILQSQDAEPEAHVWQSLKPASSKVRSQYLKREARSPRSDYREALCHGYNCPHYWVNYCPRNEES